jgi:hypothetical protein
MSPRRKLLLGAFISVMLFVLFVDWTFTVTGITTAVIERILEWIVSASSSR